MVNNQTSQYKLLYNFFYLSGWGIFQYVRAILQLSLPIDHPYLLFRPAILSTLYGYDDCIGGVNNFGTEEEYFADLKRWVHCSSGLTRGLIDITVFFFLWGTSTHNMSNFCWSVSTPTIRSGQTWTPRRCDSYQDPLQLLTIIKFTPPKLPPTVNAIKATMVI